MTTEIIDDKTSIPYIPGYRDLSVLFTTVKTDGELHYLINRSVYINGADNPSPANFSTYNIQEGDNWTLISYKLYGTIDLWWLLCKVNRIADPTQVLQGGGNIKYLPQNIVDSLLTDLRNS